MPHRMGFPLYGLLWIRSVQEMDILRSWHGEQDGRFPMMYTRSVNTGVPVKMDMDMFGITLRTLGSPTVRARLMLTGMNCLQHKPIPNI